MEKTFGVRNEELLTPDLVLPIQFQRLWHGANALTPERLLAVNVLWQAADDLLKNRGARQRDRQRLYLEAFRWVASNDRSWPYSFVNLCDALALSPGYVRGALLSDGVAAEAA